MLNGLMVKWLNDIRLKNGTSVSDSLRNFYLLLNIPFFFASNPPNGGWEKKQRIFSASKGISSTILSAKCLTKVKKLSN